MSDFIDVYGIEFTSAPSRRKPITCVHTIFDGKTLRFQALKHWHDFAGFENFLASSGPWLAGMDFPFGQARRLVENIGWPRDWAGYVGAVSTLDRKAFRAELESYKKDREAGDKHHKRGCDVISRSQSPQTLYGTPVGLMFYEGAPRLLRAGVHLPHHQDGDPQRVVLEAYPGVAVRHLIGDKPYKSDTRKKQTEDKAAARARLLELLCGNKGTEVYSFQIFAPDSLADDPGADELDALICAVQAAWGWNNRRNGYGAPVALDRLEGWICDPVMHVPN